MPSELYRLLKLIIWIASFLAMTRSACGCEAQSNPCLRRFAPDCRFASDCRFAHGLPLCVIASGVQRSAAIQRRGYNEVEVLPIVRQYFLKADNAE